LQPAAAVLYTPGISCKPSLLALISVLIVTQIALLIYGDRTTSPQRGQVRHKRGNGLGVRRSREALLCHRKRGIPHHIVGGRPEQPGRE